MAVTAAKDRIALGAILLGTTLLRLRLLAVPLERDEGEYAYMGQLILRGELPYVAAYNMKLPGVYYANALILALFGQTDVAIRIGLLLINLASITLVYLLGRKLLDATAGVSAAAAFAVLSLSPSVFGFAAKAEHFVVFFILAGVLLLAHLGTERRLALIAGAGLLLGLAVLMKQHGAAFVLFGVLYLFRAGCVVGRVSWPRAAIEGLVFVLASFTPFALTCLGMYRAEAFNSFWFWTFTYAGTYAAMIPFATGLRELSSRATSIASASVALWLLAVIGLAASWWDKQVRPQAGVLALFALCSFLSICPGLRFSPHYFIMLVPAACLYVGAAVSALSNATATRGSLVSAAVRVGVPLLAVGSVLVQERAYLFWLSPVAISRAVFGLNPFPESIEIARYLREHANTDDRVVVIGSEPEIYFYARARAATTYIYMYPLMEAHPFSQHLQEDMIAQIERERPRFVVLVNVDTSWTRQPSSARLLFDWADKTVNQEYEPVGVAEILPDGGTIYRWDADARQTQLRSPRYVVTFVRRNSEPQ